jgi:DNA-binding NarL/FixJ family response regulator
MLVDDHELLRDGLRMLLGTVPDEFVVVAEAGDGRAALGLLADSRPDVVVMDVAMPGLGGAAAATELLHAAPSLRIVVLSSHTDPARVAELMSAGAHAYVTKQAAFDELLEALRHVRQGRQYLSPGLSSRGDHVPRRRRLTPREREVAQLVAEGWTSKEIADELGCALKTVETHRRQVMDKLEVRSIAEVTKWALREGLTSTDPPRPRGLARLGD